MEMFNWPVKPDMAIRSEPRVSRVAFGDGYEQRRPDGLNNNLRQYDVTFRVLRREGGAVEDFFSRHGAVTPFLWTPPYEYRQIKVVCRKWQSRVDMLRITFTATFEQVVV
ncbi:phage tail protein [Edwardsiella tarda]|uniref:phage tail protein n=1 Tax=Edwardsiella tarda TaxID=636 RepID=UPI002443CD0F|nr:phage tail protein [Edwardsiella tarda]WGE30529.1 phage tail protein [Edwardsiella tarda]